MARSDRVTRRAFLAKAALAQATLAGAASLGARPARAQTAYPAKPVRVVVPYSAGGGADTICRTLFGQLSKDLGQTFVVDNRGGGGGTIGAGAVAKSAPDGYTLLHDATAFAVNPALFPKLPYDPVRDFEPVFLAAELPLLLLVHPSVEAKTAADLIRLAKASSDGINWASAGNGSIQHLALELFARTAGVKLNHIPYKGGAQALNDLVGGHIKFYFSNTAAATPFVKAGTVRAIAHTGKGQLQAFPDLPPLRDTLPGLEAYEWNGVFAPARTPAEVISRLSTALNAAIKVPEVTERLAALNIDTRPNSPAEFAAFVRAETERWGRLVREADIKGE